MSKEDVNPNEVEKHNEFINNGDQVYNDRDDVADQESEEDLQARTRWENDAAYYNRVEDKEPLASDEGGADLSASVDSEPDVGVEEPSQGVVPPFLGKEDPKPVQEDPKTKGFRSGFMGGLVGGLAAFALCAGIVMAMGGNILPGAATSSSSSSLSSSSSPAQTSEGQVTAAPLTTTPTDITQVVDKVKDAVVSVVNLQAAKQTDIFGRSNGSTGELTTASEGSGVIYKVTGGEAYIVTNNHVIANASGLQVLLADGTKVEATLVGSDEWTDLAVLKISAADVKTVATFGNSDDVLVGQVALAIGSPLGSSFATSVTSGIVSAKDRSVDTDVDGDGQSDWTVTAIQTDAAINPGNSGGALINASGQVIGINSMKISNSAVEGMGFAIPSNEAVQIINQLEKDGKVIRPVLGVTMINLSSISVAYEEELKLPENVTNGVILYNITANGSAEKAGLKQLDLVVEFDGQPIENIQALRKVLYSHKVGDTVPIKFYRDGKLQEVNVTLQESSQPSL